jgi:hypothetical protein
MEENSLEFHRLTTYHYHCIRLPDKHEEELRPLQMKCITCCMHCKCYTGSRLIQKYVGFAFSLTVSLHFAFRFVLVISSPVTFCPRSFHTLAILSHDHFVPGQFVYSLERETSTKCKMLHIHSPGAVAGFL